MYGQSATAADPGCAPAWALLSLLYGSLGKETEQEHCSWEALRLAEDAFMQTALKCLDLCLPSTAGAALGPVAESTEKSLCLAKAAQLGGDGAAAIGLLETALEEQPLLRRSEGKHVIELRPQVHWHKGRAVEWLLKSMCEQMGLPAGCNKKEG